jgi:hypothetical protein
LGALKTRLEDGSYGRTFIVPGYAPKLPARTVPATAAGPAGGYDSFGNKIMSELRWGRALVRATEIGGFKWGRVEGVV